MHRLLKPQEMPKNCFNSLCFEVVCSAAVETHLDSQLFRNASESSAFITAAPSYVPVAQGGVVSTLTCIISSVLFCASLLIYKMEL